MEFFGSVARVCLILMGLFVVYLIVAAWVATGSADLGVAGVVWTNPHLRIALLAFLAFAFTDMVLIGCR